MSSIIIQGIILLSLFIGLSIGAVAAFYKRRMAWSVAFLLLLALVLRVFVAADGYLHSWDERYHALVAKNLVEDFPTPYLYQDPLLPYEPEIWSANHVWLHKQPVSLLLLSGSIAVFGNFPFAVRLPSILLSSLSVRLTFLIGRRLFNSEIGFWAAFLHAIHGLGVELAGGRVATDHVDTFFAVFIEIAVFLALSVPGSIVRSRRRDAATAFFVGLAILVKWLPALVVAAVWAYLRWSEGWRWKIIGRGLMMLGLVGLVVLPWQIWTAISFPAEYQWEQHFNYLHIVEGLDGHGQPWWYFLDRIRINYGELVYWPLVMGLVLTTQQLKKREPAALLAIWFWIPFLFFSLVATKMQGYLLFTAPAIFLWTAYTFVTFWHDRKRRTWLRVLSALLILLPIRYSLERIKPFQRDYPAWQQTLDQLEALRPQEPFVLCQEPHYIEAMFQYGGTVYPFLPEEKYLEKWQSQGYRIYFRANNQYRLWTSKSSEDELRKEGDEQLIIREF